MMDYEVAHIYYPHGNIVLYPSAFPIKKVRFGKILKVAVMDFERTQDNLNSLVHIINDRIGLYYNDTKSLDALRMNLDQITTLKAKLNIN